MQTVAVLGTFDTKGDELKFVAECIRELGCEALLIDVGGFQSDCIAVDVTNEQVAAHGALDLKILRANGDRGAMVESMAQAAANFVSGYVEEKRIHGIISLGGTGGTAIGTAAMRRLPLGFPKVMVSTVASGNVAEYVGVKDILMMPSIVDISGLNQISRMVLRRAAAVVVALTRVDETQSSSSSATSKPLIVASMFGNTTACVDRCRKLLEAANFEVLTFHATGTGGRIMESLIESGVVAGVLDITTTEWADELVGGVFTAGPHRLEAAALSGVPAVVVPGCLDMVNFGPPATIPKKFLDRRFYQHNPQVTLMRTNIEESAQLGKILAEKVNLSVGPVAVLLPRLAISILSAEGEPFFDKKADEALFSAIRQHLRQDIQVFEFDGQINDPDFANMCVEELLRMIAGMPNKPTNPRLNESTVNLTLKK